MNKNQFTHSFWFYFVPCYFNKETEEIAGRNRIFDRLLDVVLFFHTFFVERPIVFLEDKFGWELDCMFAATCLRERPLAENVSTPLVKKFAAVRNLPGTLRFAFDGLSARVKIGLGLMTGACLLFLLFFVVAPLVGDFFDSSPAAVENKTLQTEIEQTSEQRKEHEKRADRVGVERKRKEKIWLDFQPEREKAQVESDAAKLALDEQEQSYENAKSGRALVDSNLTWLERRDAVLRTDAELYPDADAAAGNQ